MRSGAVAYPLRRGVHGGVPILSSPSPPWRGFPAGSAHRRRESVGTWIRPGRPGRPGDHPRRGWPGVAARREASPRPRPRLYVRGYMEASRVHMQARALRGARRRSWSRVAGLGELERTARGRSQRSAAAVGSRGAPASCPASRALQPQRTAPVAPGARSQRGCSQLGKPDPRAASGELPKALARIPSRVRANRGALAVDRIAWSMPPGVCGEGSPTAELRRTSAHSESARPAAARRRSSPRAALRKRRAVSPVAQPLPQRFTPSYGSAGSAALTLPQS